MAYADYLFYADVFKGRMSAEDFDYYSERASDYIGGKIDVLEIDDNIKKACCAVADALYEDNKNGGISAEKVGDYSINYVDKNASITLEKRLFNALKIYCKGVDWIC